MHRWYLLGLFLLFGIDGGSSVDKFSRNDSAFNTSVPDRKILSVYINDNLLSSRQLVELEKTVNIVYKHFFGPPPSKLTFRKSRDGQSSFSDSISIIGDTICNHIKNILKRFTGFSSNNGRNYKLKSAKFNPLEYVVLYQLMKMPLEIWSVIQEIQGQTKKYLKKNKYVEMGYRKSDSYFLYDYQNDSDEWQNLAISKALKNYTTYVNNCLEKSNEGPFDMKKALGKLMNHSPEKAGHIIRRRLDKPLPKLSAISKHRYTEMQAFTCHVIVNEPQKNFVKCLTEIKIFDECLNAKLAEASSRDNHGFVEKISKNFVKSIKSLDPTCSNFRGKIGYSVKCSESQKKLTSNESSYVRDFVLRGWQKSPIISGMANELISIVQKNRIGVDATREMATLISIYRNGENKRAATFLKNSRNKDENEISKKLASYKKNLATMGLETLKNINEAILNVGQIFDDSKIKVSRQNSTSNVRFFKCLTHLFESIISGWAHRNYERDDPNTIDEATNPVRQSASRVSLRVRNEIELLRNPHDQPFNEWVSSMKQLSQSPPPHRSSLLAIGKTFLLATMFYECMVILAAALYHENNVPVYQNYDAENYVNDDWEMNRKSPPQTSNHADHSIGKRDKKRRAIWISDIRNKVTGNTVQSSATVIHDRSILHDNKQHHGIFLM